MKKIKKITVLDNLITQVCDHPDLKKVVKISDVELLNTGREIYDSTYQGDYPVDIKFTEMQKVEVTYENKYYGLRKDIIVAGFDAVQYKRTYTSLYEGDYLSDRIISVKFIGEYAKNIETITLEEKED